MVPQSHHCFQSWCAQVLEISADYVVFTDISRGIKAVGGWYSWEGLSGCYSIVLNGGYEADEDKGRTFIYTGSGMFRYHCVQLSCSYIAMNEPGGKDLRSGNRRTAPQTMDQPLNNSNTSLIRSCEAKLPIRVTQPFLSIFVIITRNLTSSLFSGSERETCWQIRPL